MQQVVLIGKEFKERAKRKAALQQQTLSGIAFLGLHTFVSGRLGEFVEEGGPYPYAADRLLFVVSDDELVEEARANLPTGRTMADLYRTIFSKWFSGELNPRLA